MVHGERPADEGALLDIAGALLYVDASLDEQVAHLGGPDTGADESMLASESRKVLEVVVREAIANFADARQAFVAFVETSWDHAELAEVPRLLQEVSGALSHAGAEASGRLPDGRAPVCRTRTDRPPSRAERAPARHAGRCAGEPGVLPGSAARAARQSRRHPRHRAQQPGVAGLLAASANTSRAGVSSTAASASGDDESTIEFSEQSAGVLADIAPPQPIEPLAAVDATP